MSDSNTQTEDVVSRPPVVVVMGHIDHGKSTLLDTIRKTNITESEAGGITQHISAYKVEHKDENGDDRSITFLDTPGHEAFQTMRSRGASVADVAILIVAGDDGVQPQTLDALKAIQDSDIPYIVAINKVDKPTADVDKTINDLIENEIYLEGYGGDVPMVEISAKTGQNLDELLDLILLAGDLEELSANKDVPARGVVIETKTNPQRGISATLIIQDGTLETGMYIQAGEAIAPVRLMENFMGDKIDVATPSSPVRVTGFDKRPQIGSFFNAYEDRDAARDAVTAFTENQQSQIPSSGQAASSDFVIPVLIKGDASGTLDAIRHEINKLQTERAFLKIIGSGTGDVSENDIRRVGSTKNALVVGFNVGIDASAEELAKRLDVGVKTSDVIYDLADWLKEQTVELTPTMEVKEVTGQAQILKTFSSQGNKQVIGGKVVSGTLEVGATVRIIRNDEELAEGEILELQEQKVSTETVPEGHEFGAKVSSRVDIAPEDVIESYVIVEK